MWAHPSVARSMGWSWCCGAKGALICVSGHVWVERLEPEITSLTDVSEAIMDLVVITRGTLSPEHLFVVELLVKAL